MKSYGYTSWVEDKYEKRDKDEEKKSTHRRQKVHNVSVVLVEEQFAHLELVLVFFGLINHLAI